MHRAALHSFSFNGDRKMIELNRIYNEDCLEGMKRIPDGSVDCIICDLPYGNMKGAALDGWSKNDTIWDEQLDIDSMFVQYERVLKRNGNLILFSQEPYTSKLRSYNCNNIEFSYPLIWLKDHFANALIARKAPVSYFEDISVFYKRHDTQCLHPLREYFSHVLEYIGLSLKAINKAMGNRKAEHSFYVAGKKEVIDKIGGSADHVCRLGSSQFSLCTEDTYNKLIELFHIDKMQGFKSYIELRSINRKFERTFNIPEGQGHVSNVLSYTKDKKDRLHPTQKPVALIGKLIKTYTNEGETILDNCMGSGTTAVAAIRTKRNFIGFELQKEYFDIAQKRINQEQQQLSLF